MAKLAQELRDAVLQAAIGGRLTRNPSQEEFENKTDTLTIPSDWELKPLRNVCDSDISYGIIKLGAKDPNGVKVLRCSDVKENYIDESSVRTVTKELSAQYSRTVLNGGEVVINVRGTLGGVSVVPQHMKGYNVAREVAVLRISEGICSQYITYVLLSPYFKSFMNDSLRGIAYKGLNMGILSSFVIPLPQKNEQQRIVSRVDELMAKIDEFEVIENELEALKATFPGEMKEALLQAAMEGKLTEQLNDDDNVSDIVKALKRKPVEDKDCYFEIPETWENVHIGEMYNLVNGFAFKPSDWADEGLPIVRIQNLNDRNAAFNYYNGDIEDKYIIDNGTLLFSWSGTPGTSFGAFIWDRGKAILNQHIFILHPNAPILLDYSKYVLTAELPNFIGQAHGAVGLRHITKKKFENSVMPVPPIKEQQRIIDRLDTLLPLCDELENLQ